MTKNLLTDEDVTVLLDPLSARAEMKLRAHLEALTDDNAALLKAAQALREVAFDGPSEAKGTGCPEGVSEWRARVDAETKALLAEPHPGATLLDFLGHPTRAEVGALGWMAHRRARGVPSLPSAYASSWENLKDDLPDIAQGWTAAGMAERTAAFALAAEHVQSQPTLSAYVRPQVLAAELRTLSPTPETPAQKLALMDAFCAHLETLARDVETDESATTEEALKAARLRAALLVHRGALVKGITNS